MESLTQGNKAFCKTTPYTKDHARLNADPRTEPVVRNKVLSTRLGELELRIISYLLDNNIRRFQISDIASYYGIDRRRVWDAVQRLLRRGVVYKRDTGVYELDVEKAALLRDFQYINRITRESRSGSKDADSPQAARATANTIPNAAAHGKQFAEAGNLDDGGMLSLMGGRFCRVLRVHVRAPSGAGLIYVLGVVKMGFEALKNVLMYLKVKLAQLGFSKAAIKRYLSYIFWMMERFFANVKAVILGLHGLRNVKVDSDNIYVNLGSKEIGIDFVSDEPLPKIHLKIYTTTLDDAASRPLTSYVKAKVSAVAV